MWFFGRSRGTELIEKATALVAFGPKQILGQLYGILSILDTKAAGLLTVDAVHLDRGVIAPPLEHLRDESLDAPARTGDGRVEEDEAGLLGGACC